MLVSPVSFQARTPIEERTKDLQVFYHHIYEYKKGLRNLVLTTEKSEYRPHIEERLQGNKIDYAIQELNQDRINIFFGAKDCVEVVKTFIQTKLNKLTPEQDFMLGIMLGYDRLKQCARYLDFKKKESKE